jgi:hypothetical protein
VHLQLPCTVASRDWLDGLELQLWAFTTTASMLPSSNEAAAQQSDPKAKKGKSGVQLHTVQGQHLAAGRCASVIVVMTGCSC